MMLEVDGRNKELIEDYGTELSFLVGELDEGMYIHLVPKLKLAEVSEEETRIVDSMVYVFGDDWNEIVDAADSISQDVYEEMFTVSKLLGFPAHSRVALLDYLEVQKEFSGLGCEDEYLERVEEQLSKVYNVGMVVAPNNAYESYAEDLTEEEGEAEKNRLVDFYTKHGYKQLTEDLHVKLI